MIISGGLLCLTTLSTIFQIYRGGVMIINFVFVNEPGMHFVILKESIQVVLIEHLILIYIKKKVEIVET
jgi:hypothetical protein